MHGGHLRERELQASMVANYWNDIISYTNEQGTSE